MLSLLFVIAVMCYFHFESNTEQYTFTDWKFRTDTNTYHFWRVGENIGILAGAILFCYIQDYWLLFFSIIAGLCWYELWWNLKIYHNIWHQKSGRWLKLIRHPKGEVFVLLLIISLIGLILKII